MKLSLEKLNHASAHDFIHCLKDIFESSPWVPAQVASLRPFSDVASLHAAMLQAVQTSGQETQLQLLRAHPDLVTKLKLSSASSAEQSAAGLTSLTSEETKIFDSWNAKYREKFAFPFILCARQNKKEEILKAFPLRLAQDREREITTALEEIGKIAKLRLADLFL